MDYERWAALYDIFYKAAPCGELDYYVNAIARTGGKVLELGVGTGRIAIPAVALGHHVVGVDLSEPMLEVARRKIGDAPLPGTLQLLRCDITKLDLPKKDFDLVIVPAHTLALVLDQSSQSEVLRRAARHMSEVGKLIFNLFQPTDELLNSDPEEIFLLGVVEDEVNGGRHILTGTNRFDKDTQRNRCVQTIQTLDRDGKLVSCESLNVDFRYLHHHQVLAMLSDAGLQTCAAYGDFDGSPLTPESEEMIYVCRLP